MIPFVATGAGLRASLQEGFLECQHPHQLMTKLCKLLFEIWPESLILKKLKNLYERLLRKSLSYPELHNLKNFLGTDVKYIFPTHTI